ncbi:hypothetical protein SESBI_10099 [Sesbania bispinosa]|nr:hypothetical protein SESBI_10099 [Sesbania bispinosa]
MNAAVDGDKGRFGRLFLMKQSLIFCSTLSIVHFEVCSSPSSPNCIGSPPGAAPLAEESEFSAGAGTGEWRAERKVERLWWAW